MRVPVLVFVCLVAVMSTIGETHAQAPAQPAPPIEGNIHTAIYVEVLPTSTAAAIQILKRYRELTSKEDGNLRSEGVQRIGEPHQFVILSVWKDKAAHDAHGKGAGSTEMRDKIAAIRNAPTDERVHTGLAVAALGGKPARDTIVVVTHVDVIPPRKDDGAAAVKQLAEDSRQHDGNVRFEVGQQTNRPNHFTVVEVWKDAKSVDAHSMAPATRQFRDKLAPASGALYDERKYKPLD